MIQSEKYNHKKEDTGSFARQVELSIRKKFHKDILIIHIHGRYLDNLGKQVCEINFLISDLHRKIERDKYQKIRISS